MRLDEEKKRKKKPQGKNIMVCPIHRATIKIKTDNTGTMLLPSMEVASEVLMAA